ncbi:MAG TPA: 50S ribosomal protein L13 [Longimicrobiales bacterium]|nr:50S ribosomal protein L13 [Longimicrobiales bacterium]
MKTYTPKPGEVERRWYVVDADGEVLGRLATRVAEVLRGKHKPAFTPHLDTGDYVIVVNAAKVRVTGRKFTDKMYFTHSGYMGGEKLTPFSTMIAKNPTRVIDLAVKGMLPKNNLGRLVRKKLKVYAGGEHPHVAQQPRVLEI